MQSLNHRLGKLDMLTQHAMCKQVIPACNWPIGSMQHFKFAIAYLDDIIIFSKMAEEHLDHIKQVFKKLRIAHMSMKLSKCHFFTKEMQYLDHILSTKGIKLLPSKNTSNSEQVRVFLGLVGFYRKFIKKLCKNSEILDINNPSTSKI